MKYCISIGLFCLPVWSEATPSPQVGVSISYHDYINELDASYSVPEGIGIGFHAGIQPQIIDNISIKLEVGSVNFGDYDLIPIEFEHDNPKMEQRRIRDTASVVEMSLKPTLTHQNLSYSVPVSIGYNVLRSQQLPPSINGGFFIKYGVEVAVDLKKHYLFRSGVAKDDLDYLSFYSGIGYKF